MKTILAALAASAAAVATAVAAQVPAEDWRIGPIIKGRNYSVGMPPSLREGPQGHWFAFPGPNQGHVHYVTLDIPPLQGARQITVRYRIDAPRGTRFVAQEDGANGTFGLAFQRAGDNWTAKGRYEAYRWYSPQAVPLTPGTHTFVARLDDPRWISVMGGTSANNPRGFADALNYTQNISLTFGSASARGHGVYATAPARFTLLDFRIE